MPGFFKSVSGSRNQDNSTSVMYNVEDIDIHEWTVDDFANWLSQKNYKKKIIKSMLGVLLRCNIIRDDDDLK